MMAAARDLAFATKLRISWTDLKEKLGVALEFVSGLFGRVRAGVVILTCAAAL